MKTLEESSTSPQILVSPTMSCRRIHLADDASWVDVDDAFRLMDSVTLRQAWRNDPEPDFAPAHVRVGWDGRSLLVYAGLADEDIYNPVTVFNEPAFMKGDAFEIFLKPVEQDAYREYHVTPGNQKFQLRIPSKQAFYEQKPGSDIGASWAISDRVIGSRVRVEPDEKMWWLLATIPLDMVSEGPPPTAGSQWLFSFSRYDYTRGRAQPVLSSSSPHEVIGFHRQQEWGTLTFA